MQSWSISSIMVCLRDPDPLLQRPIGVADAGYGAFALLLSPILATIGRLSDPAARGHAGSSIKRARPLIASHQSLKQHADMLTD